MNPLKQIMDIKNASEKWGLKPSYIKDLCRLKLEQEGKAIKLGNTWVLVKNQPNPSQPDHPKNWRAQRLEKIVDNQEQDEVEINSNNSWKMNPLKQIMDIKEASEKWGLKPSYIKDLCRLKLEQEEKAIKMGNIWVLIKDQPNPGQPDHPKNWRAKKNSNEGRQIYGEIKFKSNRKISSRCS
ncbi:hypothetical protein IAQ67_15355 [Paenibacillus peoriae]|uniref:DNA-binding protein n=1 Tax=Paenibacillus peoriae TaxID=59893 RepID=A0A7H0Y2H4_9BACL|nr:hypothetical protein [Paenibacillus peoriae]QNR65282.1 hypothetical protein IAQ67_15355 [Paenibacillus peoriae]